jgi:hypothetical protein
MRRWAILALILAASIALAANGTGRTPRAVAPSPEPAPVLQANPGQQPILDGTRPTPPGGKDVGYILQAVTGGNMQGPVGWGSYSMGYLFTPTQSGAVTQLGRYRGSYNESSTIKLWDAANGTLLASTTISNSGWSYNSVSPVMLTVGHQYWVTTYGGSNVYYYNMPSVPYTVNGVQIINGGYNTGDAMPIYSGGTTVYGAPDIYFGAGASYDVGPTAVLNPPSVCSLGTYTPQVRVLNMGTQAQTDSFWVKFKATGAGTYTDSAKCPPMAAESSKTVSFPSWTITAKGGYTVSCSTMSTHDSVPDDNKLTTSIRAGLTRVLFITADYPSDVKNLADSIMNAFPNDFVIDTMDVGYSYTRSTFNVDSAINIKKYRAMITWANYGYTDSYALGDSLAAYMERGGGGVAWAPFGIYYDLDRFTTYYSPQRYGNVNYGYVTKGTVQQPSHKIMTSVSTIAADYYSYSGTTLDHTTAYKVCDWSDGNILAACNDTLNRRAALLGVFPVGATWGYMHGDWKQLMRNYFSWLSERHDVGVQAIEVPAGTIDSGLAVTPACSVANWGTETETYKVKMQIGSTYTESTTVTNHASGGFVRVTFPSWTPSVKGSIAVACSTRLAGDRTTSNDKKTGTVLVAARDVGVSRIVAPTGSVDSGSSVTPACSVANFGTAAVACSVRMRIGTGYNAAHYVSVAGGSRVYVTFPDWTALARGSNAVSCSTELAADVQKSNDKATGTVNVNVYDVGTKVIVAPIGTIAAGTVVTPACSVYNYATATPTYAVHMKFGTYNQTATVTAHAPGTAVFVTFPTWTAVVGVFPVSCSTELATDVNATNDKATGTVTVTAGGGGGAWAAKSSMPAGAKAIKDGGWLAYDVAGTDAGTGRIYASRGVKTTDFFSYNPANDSWKALAPWLPGTEAKPPSKGSAACADGNGHVYATKGNNTTGFYAYDAGTNAWAQKKDVPLGLSNKKVKGGTALAWGYKGGVGAAYVLKGYKNEFYKYTPTGDSWTTLAPAPGAMPKWDKGSWLAYDDVNKKVYAFQAKYMAFYSYDTEKDSWSAALAPMPAAGSAGSKKAKDGSCGAFFTGSIYALKGGNTQEFWKYTIASNSWAEKETLPKGTMKKKVKAGGSITTAGLTLYAIKGNKSDELWQYVPGGAFMAPSDPEREGVMAGKTVIAQGVSITPNPLASGFAVLRYSLPKAGSAQLSVYNVAGQTVVSQTLVAGRSGIVNLDLKHLSNGVYLVKLSSEGFVNSQKLVVQR